MVVCATAESSNNAFKTEDSSLAFSTNYLSETLVTEPLAVKLSNEGAENITKNSSSEFTEEQLYSPVNMCNKQRYLAALPSDISDSGTTGPSNSN